jgi:hypothetical protein
MFLTSTSHIIRVVTDAGVTVRVTADWLDIVTATEVITPGHTTTAITTATTTTVVAAPAAGAIRRVIGVTVANIHAATAVGVTVESYDGSNAGRKMTGTLAAAESFQYAESTGWDRYGATGKRQTSGVDGANGANGAAGVGTTGEAELNFGAFPGASDASVAVTGQAAILTTSKVEAWLRLTATADHSADEHWVETIAVYAGNISAGVGFTIYGKNTNTLNEPNLVGSTPQRSHGAAGGINTKRPINIGGKGTRIYGRWTIQWRWSD